MGWITIARIVLKFGPCIVQVFGGMKEAKKNDGKIDHAETAQIVKDGLKCAAGKMGIEETDMEKIFKQMGD
jgi:hypothetical protein